MKFCNVPPGGMFAVAPLEKQNNRTYTDRWQTIEHFWFYTIKFFLFLQKQFGWLLCVFYVWRFVGEASADLSDGKKTSRDFNIRKMSKVFPMLSLDFFHVDASAFEFT